MSGFGGGNISQEVTSLHRTLQKNCRVHRIRKLLMFAIIVVCRFDKPCYLLFVR